MAFWNVPLRVNFYWFVQLTRMSHGASQIDQTSFGQKNNILSILECKSINLRFDVSFLFAIFFDPLDINLTIEMTNVAYNGIIFHCHEVLASDDVLATSCGHKNVGTANSIINGGDFITFASCLQGIDRIDLFEKCKVTFN